MTLCTLCKLTYAVRGIRFRTFRTLIEMELCNYCYENKMPKLTEILKNKGWDVHPAIPQLNNPQKKEAQ